MNDSDDVKELLDRVLTWSPERQADVAEVVRLMEEQDKSSLRLTDEQVAKVRRRRANKNPKYISLAEARKRFAAFVADRSAVGLEDQETVLRIVALRAWRTAGLGIA